MLVYLNGQYTPASEAKISIDDRGFLFADGVYEVARVYGGRIFALAEHLERMRSGLAALQIRPDGADGVAEAAERLVRENGVGADGIVYVQVTRGCAPRKHAFPEADTACTVYVAARAIDPYPAAYFERGVSAVTTGDTRWSRCDIKSVSLLPNVLANQQAHAAGAFEALFVRDGVLIEGSHSNLLGVIDDTLVTYPACNYILAGITRAIVLELARELDIRVALGPIHAHELDRVQELFLSGTTTEVMPVVEVDGRPVAGGAPGPVTRRLQQAFRERVTRG